MSVERTLASMGLSVPEVPAPVASYAPAVRSGNLVYTSGQLPGQGAALRRQGRVGAEVSEEEGYQAARIAALNCLAAIKSVIGDLNKVTRIVRVTGYVNSAQGFTNQAVVINGASEFLLQVFGDAGQHARVAIGVYQLPRNACVEVDVIAEVQE